MSSVPIAASRCGSAAMRNAACAAPIIGFAKKIKLRSYPLVERGGVLWAYMGPPEHTPPLPESQELLFSSPAEFSDTFLRQVMKNCLSKSLRKRTLPEITDKDPAKVRH